MAQTTLTQYRSRISAILGLDNTSGADQDLIDAWVNEGYENLVLRTHCNSDLATMALTSGTRDYTLPTQIMAIDEVYNTQSSTQYPMERVSVQEMTELRRATGAAPTRFYTVRGSNLILLYPTPGSNETLTITYVPRPTPLSAGGDIPSDVPAEFQQVIEWYALFRGADYDEHQSSGFGTKYLALYEEGVRRLRAASRGKGGNRLPAAKIGRRPRLIPADPSQIVQHR